jgi:hypothetical protein
VPREKEFTDAQCPSPQSCDGKGACRAPCTNDDACDANEFCDSGGQCRIHLPSGMRCMDDESCSSGICQSGFCCRETCEGCYACTGPGGTCEPLGAQLPDLRPEMPCTGLLACDGQGTCRQTTGSTCETDTQCASGHCTDGTCCEKACDGVCEVCRRGICTDVKNASDDDSGRGDFQCDNE